MLKQFWLLTEELASHSLVSAEGQMNASMTCQPLKYDRGTSAFISPMLQICGGKKARGYLVIV